MSGSVISKRGSKSSSRAKPQKTTLPSINDLMEEVGGVIDQAIEQAAREAALQHIRDGRNVPVWEDGKVVWKPAAQALAEADAAVAAEKRKRR